MPFRRPSPDFRGAALPSPVALAAVLAVLSIAPPAALSAAALPTAAQEPPGLAGFTASGSDRQATCEQQFLRLPSSDSFREHLRTITAQPHPAGSEAQRRVGRYLHRAMEEAGLEVRSHPYDVYLPQLTDDVEAHIVTPVAMRLSNREPALEEDRFSGHPNLLNGWNAFSGSGDETAEVVYANFGRREDYLALDSMGVSVEGKVVIARYGGNFRGYKVKFAEERGAAAVIMFNDPGPGTGGLLPYPDGPMMNSETIQRGSVLVLPWTGDPLTPFQPALPLDGDREVVRLDPSEIALHTIPVLPLGYGSASEILTHMEGSEAPAEWQGGIEGVTYRIEGGPGLTVRVRVNQPKEITRVANVVGTLRGSEFPNEWFILGAHYDPWGFGAIDPNGGTAMLLTLAEALGQLAEAGCAPRRSIMIAHWDAEEAGIIGSTEWVEEFRTELEANAIAYINADGAVSGSNFGGSSSPSLKAQVIEATKAVAYPGTDRTLYRWWIDRRGSDTAGEPSLGNLGGGSDHVGFYTHAGVPSGALSSSNPGGVYHSNYDNFAWFERFGDTEFVFGPMVARADGILALRFANADLLPYDLVRYATDLRTHMEGLHQAAEARGLEVELGALAAAVDDLEDAARDLEAARSSWTESGTVNPAAAEPVNRALIGLEKAWLNDRGLQGRPWSRSLYVSPDPFSGYASWMLPGLRYEIETDNRAALPGWERVYVNAVRNLAARMRAAEQLIEENR